MTSPPATCSPPSGGFKAAATCSGVRTSSSVRSWMFSPRQRACHGPRSRFLAGPRSPPRARLALRRGAPPPPGADRSARRRTHGHDPHDLRRRPRQGRARIPLAAGGRGDSPLGALVRGQRLRVSQTVGTNPVARRGRDRLDRSHSETKSRQTARPLAEKLSLMDEQVRRGSGLAPSAGTIGAHADRVDRAIRRPGWRSPWPSPWRSRLAARQGPGKGGVTTTLARRRRPRPRAPPRPRARPPRRRRCRYRWTGAGRPSSGCGLPPWRPVRPLAAAVSPASPAWLKMVPIAFRSLGSGPDLLLIAGQDGSLSWWDSALLDGPVAPLSCDSFRPPRCGLLGRGDRLLFLGMAGRHDGRLRSRSRALSPGRARLGTRRRDRVVPRRAPSRLGFVVGSRRHFCRRCGGAPALEKRCTPPGLTRRNAGGLGEASLSENQRRVARARPLGEQPLGDTRLADCRRHHRGGQAPGGLLEGLASDAGTLPGDDPRARRLG